MNENIEISDLILVYLFDLMEEAEKAYLRDKDVPFINDEVVKCLLDSYTEASKAFNEALATTREQHNAKLKARLINY